jgi:transposase
VRHRETRKTYQFGIMQRFEDNLVIVLDRALYFQASAVTDLAARDDLVFVTLPSYSSELNPAEKGWRQLQASLSNCFFDSPDDPTTAIHTALDQLFVPNVSNYF